MNPSFVRQVDAATSTTAASLPGDLLVLYRKRSGWSQKELAHRLGLKSRRTIHTWETSHNAPNPAALRKLIELYLRQGIFLPGQQMAEAGQLWTSFKNLFDAVPERFVTYPAFDRAWFQRLLQESAPQPTGAGSSRALSESVPNNLPLPVTRLVDRTPEIVGIKQALAETRLLTLTGSGGVGKSTLQLKVAQELMSRFPEGVWLVELAPLVLQDQALLALAQTLGLRPEDEHPLLEVVLDFLRDRRTLLLLDNCEHLLEGCVGLTQAVLEACPHVQFLLSSREALRVPGEHVWIVASLSLPEQESGHKAEELLQYEAIELFSLRAHEARPDFRLSEQNASSVAHICRQLDGIPLALELAAARTRSLTVEEIDSRLDQRFRLLTGGNRAALPRQQTLRALMDWSYELLNEQERRLVHRLGVFRGGWTLPAAEVICAGEEIEEWEVLDLQTSLVDKSLALAEQKDGRTRYRLLETVRQYAWERLVESGEDEAMCARHRDYFLELAETALPQLSGPEQVQWYARLEAEHDNLYAALTSCPETMEGTWAGLRMVVALGSFWEVRGDWAEGRAWCERMLSRPETRQDPAGRASALNVAGALARAQGQRALALAQLEESLKLCQDLGDRAGMALTLLNLGQARDGDEDPMPAKACYEESLGLFREIGDSQGIARVLCQLAILSMRLDDRTRAQALMEEALRMRREAGDGRNIAFCLYNLGLWAREHGDLAGGQRLLQEALPFAMESQDGYVISEIIYHLSLLASQKEDYAAALALLEQGMAIARTAGDKRSLSYYCVGLTLLALEQDDLERAQAAYAQALEGFREAGNKAGPAIIAPHPGHWCMRQGDYAGARARYEEAVALRREIGNPFLTACALVEAAHAAWCQTDYAAVRAYLTEALNVFRHYRNDAAFVITLESFAGLAAMEARHERAARLFGAVDQLYTTLKLPRHRYGLLRLWLVPQKRIRDAAGDILEAEAYARAREEGRAMPLERAIEYALSPDTPPRM
jgi:predicted ATPase/transcriptional regulator with XRE-family HTH domain